MLKYVGADIDFIVSSASVPIYGFIKTSFWRNFDRRADGVEEEMGKFTQFLPIVAIYQLTLWIDINKKEE